MRRDPDRLNRHGTYSCFSAGCPCELCADANRRYHRRRRQRLGGQSRADYDRDRHRHPSLNCYKRHRCRCEGCKRWNAADVRYRAERRALR